MKTKILIGLVGLTVSLLAFAESVKSVYIVPPSSSDGTSVTYPLQYTTLTTAADGTRTIVFKLPEDLIGGSDESYTLNEIKGTNTGFLVFTDGRTFLSCAETDTLMNCSIKYPKDFAKEYPYDDVGKFLKNKFASQPDLLKSRLETARRFNGDPEGVLVIYR